MPNALKSFNKENVLFKIRKKKGKKISFRKGNQKTRIRLRKLLVQLTPHYGRNDLVNRLSLGSASCQIPAVELEAYKHSNALTQSPAHKCSLLIKLASPVALL